MKQNSNEPRTKIDRTTAQSPSKSLYLHPDELYDAPYEKTKIEESAYKAINGTVSVIHQRDTHIQLKWGLRTFSIEAAGAGTLRFRMLPKSVPERPSTTESLKLLKVRHDGTLNLKTVRDTVVISHGNLELRINSSTGQIKLIGKNSAVLWATDFDGLRLSEDPASYNGGDRFLIEGALNPQEHFFGFGGRIAPPDRRGDSADMFSVKTGKVSGDYGGFPLPYYISTLGYGFFLNNPWPHVYFDLGRENPDRWFIHAPGGDLDIFFFDGPGFAEIIQRFTELTGRAPAVPRWVMGFWCSSLLFNQSEQALKDAERLRAENYPADVFVFDGPWRGGCDFAATYQAKQEYPSNDMEWHSDFGDGPEMIRKLKEKGIQTSLHLNSRNYRPETTRKGLESGLLRQHGEEVVPRVLNLEAEAYFKEMVAPRIKEGVALWWTDHSDRVSGELAPGLPSRNLFGPLWNRLLSEAMQEHGHPAHMSLSRGGGIGSQPYAIPWPGDTRCGLDALADDIWFMINAGLSGFPLSSADLGGFVPSKNPNKDYPNQEAVVAEMFSDENICRRVCHCLFFTPVPRIHNNASTPPKLPWNCSEHLQDLYRKALHVRYQLTPYLYSYILAATETGEPILRPLAYHHPNDATALSYPTEFYLGESLLCAPVTSEGVEQWEVYLPEGDWIHLWSGCSYTGKTTIKVEAPLHELSGLPVFVRDGSILPRQPITPSLGNTIPETLELTLYAYKREQGELTLHEAPRLDSRFAFEIREGNCIIQMKNPHEFTRTFNLKLMRRCKEIQKSVSLSAKSSEQIIVPLT